MSAWALIASVDITDGKVIPRGQHHGLSWGFAGNLGISCIRARCRKCKYDGSTDYAVLCAELAAAVRGRVIYL